MCAAHQGNGGQYRGVGGAAPEHDVRAGLHRGDVRLGPQQGDDVLAGVEVGVVIGPAGSSGLIAPRAVRLEDRLVLLGIEHRDLQGRASRAISWHNVQGPIHGDVAPEEPQEPINSGTPAAARAAIKSSRSRRTGPTLYFERAVASEAAPLSVDPASRAMTWGPRAIPARSSSALTPEPSCPAGTSTVVGVGFWCVIITGFLSFVQEFGYQDTTGAWARQDTGAMTTASVRTLRAVPKRTVALDSAV